MRIADLSKIDANRYRPFLFPASGYPQASMFDGTGNGEAASGTNLWVHITGLDHRIAVASNRTNYVFEQGGTVECNQTGFPVSSWPIAKAETDSIMVTDLQDVREL